MFNLIGRYLATRGRELSADPCHSSDDCAYRTPPPVDSAVMVIGAAKGIEARTRK